MLQKQPAAGGKFILNITVKFEKIGKDLIFCRKNVIIASLFSDY